MTNERLDLSKRVAGIIDSGNIADEDIYRISYKDGTSVRVRVEVLPDDRKQGEPKHD